MLNFYPVTMIMPTRYPAIDTFRGLTIVLMIVVNSINPHAKLHWLQHASWNGCSIADCVFPFFLLTLGISLVLKGQIDDLALIRRSLVLLSLGLGLNAFPHFHPLRIPGVLQRIGLCYLLAGLIYHHTEAKTQIKLIICLLLSYWLFNRIFPTTEAGHLQALWSTNAIGWIDQALFSSKHLLSPHFDPEGLISTWGALATTLIGIHMGRTLIQHPRQIWWQGCIYLSLASTWQLIYPINKAIWTGSYVLYTAGLASFILACCISMPRLTALENMGRHSLMIFVLHVIGLKLLHLSHLWPCNLPNFNLNLTALGFSFIYTLGFFILIHLLLSPKTQKSDDFSP